MKEDIIYISHYDHEINKDENRQYSPACKNLTEYIAKLLTKKDFKVSIISLAPTLNNAFYHGKNIRIYENINLTLPPTFNNKNYFIRKFKNFYQLILSYIYIFKHIKNNSKVIVYHSVSLCYPIILIKLIKKCKIILQVEEIYADVNNIERYRKKENKIFNIADGFIFPTIQLNKIINSKNKPYCIIHGVYTQKKVVNRKFSDGKIHCVYAGTFDRTKGGAILSINSSKYLGKDFVMHILGFGSQQEKDYIKNLIKEADREKRECKVFFEGEKDGEEFTSFIQKCDIGLATQNPDGVYNLTSFPSKVLMYLANGLKVISTDIDVLRTSNVCNMVNFVKEANPKSVADAILRVSRTEKVDLNKFLKKLEIDFSEQIIKVIDEVYGNE